MVNEAVKIKNRLNELPLRNFNAREMNLFFTICQRVKNKGTDEVTIPFWELRELSQYDMKGSAFIADLESMYTKLLSLNLRTDDGSKIVRFVAFPRYIIDRDEKTVSVSVAPEFKRLFNFFVSSEPWTKFRLDEFTGLKSTYSKAGYRLCMQFHSTGRVIMAMDWFREYFCVPKSYTVSEIDKRVIKYLKEELPPYIKGFSISKRRASKTTSKRISEQKVTGRGAKVTGYTITFKPFSLPESFSAGGWVERNRQLENIKHNGDLTREEKAAATDRVLSRYDLSLSDVPDWANPIYETPEDKRARRAANSTHRAQLSITLSKLREADKNGELDAEGKKQLAQTEKEYARLKEE